MLPRAFGTLADILEELAEKVRIVLKRSVISFGLSGRITIGCMIGATQVFIMILRRK
jgi:putative transposon-encoded protein